MVARNLPAILALFSYVDWSARFSKLTRREKSYAHQLWISDSIEALALSRVELVILGIFWTFSETGYFAIASMFMGLVCQLAFQASPVLVVGFSGMGSQKRSVLYRAAFSYMALFALPISFGGAAISPVLMPLVFGDNFEPAVGSSIILMLGAGPAALSVIPWAYLAGCGHGRALLWLSIVTMFSSLLILLLAVPSGGVLAAAGVRAALEVLVFSRFCSNCCQGRRSIDSMDHFREDFSCTDTYYFVRVGHHGKLPE